MNIEEYMKKRHKRLSNNNISDSKIKYLKQLISRVLLSIILVISIGIYIKMDAKNILLVDKYFFTDSLKFTKINNWYQEKIGKIIPDIKNNETSLVFNSDDLKLNKYENYLNGVKIYLNKSSPISLINGGIIVFIGEKEGYGNTLILQGNDGVDYWYGGITNISVNLYDYLEKNTLIGETKDDYLYLVLEKDGSFLSYEEYLL